MVMHVQSRLSIVREGNTRACIPTRGGGREGEATVTIHDTLPIIPLSQTAVLLRFNLLNTWSLFNTPAMMKLLVTLGRRGSGHSEIGGVATVRVGATQ